MKSERSLKNPKAHRLKKPSIIADKLSNTRRQSPMIHLLNYAKCPPSVIRHSQSRSNLTYNMQAELQRSNGLLYANTTRFR